MDQEEKEVLPTIEWAMGDLSLCGVIRRGIKCGVAPSRQPPQTSQQHSRSVYGSNMCDHVQSLPSILSVTFVCKENMGFLNISELEYTIIDSNNYNLNYLYAHK